MSGVPGLEEVTEQDVLINGTAFTAITGYSVNQQATIPTHKTEQGFQLADHIFLENVAITITLKLFKEQGEREMLDALMNSKIPITIYSELGSYDNVVIECMKVDRGDTKNTYIANLTLKQIRVGNAVEVSMSLPISVSTSNLPGSTSAKTPDTKLADDPAEPVVEGESATNWFNGSWYDTIFNKSSEVSS